MPIGNYSTDPGRSASEKKITDARRHVEQLLKPVDSHRKRYFVKVIYSVSVLFKIQLQVSSNVLSLKIVPHIS